MKKAMSFLKNAGLVICLLCVTIELSATKLTDALKNGTVTLKANAHEGKNINLILMNLQAATQEIEIEPGTILTSGDAGVQQAMLVQRKVVELPPNGTLATSAYGMCINAKRSGFFGQDLNWHAEAEDKLKEVATFVAAHQLFDETGQKAVWVVSDNHDLSGIHHEDADVMLNTRQYLSALTGKPVPWYVKHYASAEFESCSGPVFSDEVASIEGNMEFYLRTNGALTFGIYNERGDLVQLFFSGRGTNPGEYSCDFTLEATNLKKGKYYARVWNDGNLVKQREIEI
ncbi:MAG: hypothetical protein WD077_15775 [Bacteroidia bacterium]